jgi:hypothetical protein
MGGAVQGTRRGRSRDGSISHDRAWGDGVSPVPSPTGIPLSSPQPASSPARLARDDVRPHRGLLTRS